MYLRPVHSTYHIPTLYNFIRGNPLGLFTTVIPSEAHPSLQSSHIPFLLDNAADLTPTILESNKEPSSSSSTETPALDAAARREAGQPLGTLRAHLSRANPQAKAIITAAKATTAGIATSQVDESTPTPDGAVTLPGEVLVMFTGPVQHYVTPKFYTLTKPESGKVVPTWNYEAVEAYGTLTVYPSTTSDAADEFLSSAIADLSHLAEVGLGFDGKEGRAEEWEVADAPGKFIGLLKKSIVGIKIEITRLGGKWKMSQEMKEGDRNGVSEGFSKMGNEEMAESVKVWGERAKKA